MRRRLTRKRLRPLERMLSNACRLYITRPRAANADNYESVARSLVELQLSFLLDEQARVGIVGLRGYRAEEVALGTLEASTNDLHGLGTVKLERVVLGGKEERVERFRFRCVVPWRSKTRRSDPRPEVSLLTGTGTA